MRRVVPTPIRNHMYSGVQKRLGLVGVGETERSCLIHSAAHAGGEVRVTSQARTAETAQILFRGAETA